MTQTPQTQGETLHPNYEKLLQAFDLFTSASASLQNSYLELQCEARRLSSELECANAELIRSLEAREKIQNYLSSILESLSNGVLVVNPDGMLTVCNPAASRMLGLPQFDWVTARQFEALPLPDKLRAWIRESLQASAVLTEDAELEVARAEGNSRFFMVSRSPVIDPKGNCSGTTIILKDITQLKELEHQTQRAQRLQAMGEMAVQLAHEIRNPLGSIELFASLLKSELQPGTDTRTWAEQISTGIRFLNTIVSNMLSFARASKAQVRHFDLGELIETTLSFVEPVFAQRRIQVKLENFQEPICMDGDPEMLRQMLMNLFMNALQAMPEEGNLKIRTRQPSTAWVEIEVEDSGIGIAPENIARIFDPFFTTNENGTGLGLSLVCQIVEKHQGRVEARSESGKGTSFTVCLPLGRSESC